MERCAKINIRNFCSASETIMQTVQVLHFSVILVVKGVLHDENCLLCCMFYDLLKTIHVELLKQNKQFYFTIPNFAAVYLDNNSKKSNRENEVHFSY